MAVIRHDKRNPYQSSSKEKKATGSSSFPARPVFLQIEKFKAKKIYVLAPLKLPCFSKE